MGGGDENDEPIFDAVKAAKVHEMSRQLATEDKHLQKLFDPISLDIMEDPIIASDGIAYDRSTFTSWVETHKKNNKSLISPITGEPLTEEAFPPTEDLLQMRESFVKLGENYERNIDDFECVQIKEIGEYMLSSDIFRDFDRLKNMNVLSDLNLRPPQIVVLGNESHGKSTLLERLIGFPIFPRDRGLCTRCPIKVSTLTHDHVFYILKIKPFFLIRCN